MDTFLPTLFEHAEKGDTSAADTLFDVLHAELHRLAKVQIARSSGKLTLGTTTLLHEACLNMAGREKAVFPDRARFMAYAARAMRGLILHHARDRQTLRRGGELSFTPLDEAIEMQALRQDDLERMGAALDGPAAVEPRLAEVIDLKFFSGFSFEEIAGMWGVSDRTVQRDRAKARIFLHGTLGRSVA